MDPKRDLGVGPGDWRDVQVGEARERGRPRIEDNEGGAGLTRLFEYGTR